MRLSLILLAVEPGKYVEPKYCANMKCKGEYIRLRQVVQKKVRDSQYDQVVAYRYECLRCRRTFRVYPQGVLAGQFSQRAKGMGVMLYVLGLSYGAVTLMKIFNMKIFNIDGPFHHDVIYDVIYDTIGDI
jgi:hypothetical protein